MSEDQLSQDLKDLIEQAAAGVDLGESAQSIAAYAASRAAYLSTLVALPGFQEAVMAERDNVALRAGIVASSIAKSSEAQLLGVLQGALAIGARALVIA